MKKRNKNDSELITDSLAYKEDYLLKFALKSDEELITEFNKYVRIDYFNFHVQGISNALWDTFKIRGIDYSAIGDERSISFRDKIGINDKIIYICEKEN